MWVTINFMLWGLLVLSLLAGLTRRYAKRIVQSLIWSRLFYLLIITSQFVISVRVFAHHPILVVVSALLCIGSIVLIEVNYRNLELQKLRPASVSALVVGIGLAVLCQSIAIQ